MSITLPEIMGKKPPKRVTHHAGNYAVLVATLARNEGRGERSRLRGAGVR
jgi:hypothetical protein